MNLSNKDVEIIAEKLKFHKSEVKSFGDIQEANLAYTFAIKKICEIITFKRFDLFEQLIDNKEPAIVFTMTLFLLPISETKAFKRLFKLFFMNEYSFDAKTLWGEYKMKNQLKFPKLINNKVVYVSKEEYLDQFTKEETKLINSFI